MIDTFKTEFKGKFKNEPLMFADYAYDSVTLLKFLANRPKKEWKELIAGYRFDGVSGEVGFDDNGTRFPDAELRIYTKGKFQKYKESKSGLNFAMAVTHFPI